MMPRIETGMIKAKLKKCKVCPEKFQPYSSLTKVCSPKCALVLVEKNKDKKHRKEKTAFRIEDKSVSKWISEAQSVVNGYARIRDYYDPCISCGASKAEIELKQGWKTGGCWDGGHFQSRGKKPQLRFNLNNIHKQCKGCNGGSGKYAHKEMTTDEKYKANLILKIGAEKVEYLETYNGFKKYDRIYCERVKKIFNKKTRIQKKRLGIE